MCGVTFDTYYVTFVISRGDGECLGARCFALARTRPQSQFVTMPNIAVANIYGFFANIPSFGSCQ